MDSHNQAAAGEPRETGAKPPKSLFGDEAPQTPLPPPDSQPAPNVAAKPFNLLTRVVLPFVVFVVGIACLAWVVQQLPRRDGKTAPVEGKENELREGLAFAHQEWTDASRKYPVEFEVNTDGSHDFPFENLTGKDMDVGVAKTNCQCAKVEIGVFKDTQQKEAYAKALLAGNQQPTLETTKLSADKEMKDLVLVPAGSAGVVRVYWRGKTEPVNQGIEVYMWCRPAGTARDRGYQALTIGISYVLPVLFDQDKVEFGVVLPQGKATQSFVCWSATRDLEVKPANTDKCLVVEVVPLKGKEYDKKALPLLGASMVGSVGGPADQGPFGPLGLAIAEGDSLPDSLKTRRRVPSAFRVNLTLYEQRDGKQLDLGQFREDAPIVITSNGKPIDLPSGSSMPVLKATVRGDVTVQVPPEDGGKINLGLFKTVDGVKRTVYIFAPKGAALTFVRGEPALLDLEVKLKELQPIGDKGRWEMELKIPPGGSPGPLPDDSVIVLRCDLPAQGNTPALTRLARIPVAGSGTAKQ